MHILVSSMPDLPGGEWQEMVLAKSPNGKLPSVRIDANITGENPLLADARASALAQIAEAARLLAVEATEARTPEDLERIAAKLERLLLG